ncbi:MAG: class I SAM-dependent methyltransferase [Candidatus Rokuibacteriota bacterium]
MSRFVLLDSGEELSAATEPRLTAAGAPVALRLLEDAPPFPDCPVFHVAPAAGVRARGLVLCRAADGYALRPAAEARDTALARVVSMVYRSSLFPIGRAPLRWLSPPWLVRALRVLEILNRFRHPLTPPMFLGSADACLDGVRAKYGDPVEVREYRRHALGGAEPDELDFIRAHAPPGARVLDVGCGAGREALGLARIGYRVTGIDLAPAMVEAARRLAAEAGLSIEFRAQNVMDLEDPPGSWDAVYLGAPLHHIPGRARRVATLAQIRRALAPDGVLLLMLAYRDCRPWSRSRLVDVCRRVGARVLGSDRVSEPGDDWMLEVSQASDPHTPVFFHNFDGPDDVRDELEAAGFASTEVKPGWWVCHASARVT